MEQPIEKMKMANRPDEYYRSLVAELSKLTDETEWVEFKVGNDQPERIAKYISAFSNPPRSAASPQPISSGA